MSKKIKLILVANSVPLSVTDFLKHKIFFLSKHFDLHFFCWGTGSDREKFNRQYAAKVQDSTIHLFYDKLNTTTLMLLVFRNILRLLLYPGISIPILRKLSAKYKGDRKAQFVKFTHYFSLAIIRPDIIHFEYGILAQRFSDIKEFIDCKVSVSFRGYDINYVGLDEPGYYNTVWSQFDGFHFLGNDLRQRAIKRGYKEGKAEALIPPGIDTTAFTPSAITKAADRFVIVSVGRLTWKKGYEYALQVIAMLKKQRVPVEYRIIGAGNHKQAVLFTVSELGLENDVKLLGELPPELIQKELNTAHVFLHPAVSEGFCNAVLEAQAVGLPVIATNADGLAENIADGVTGFIVPVYDVQAMADKLQWCYANQDKLPEIGKAGAERVGALFTIEQQMNKFENFYNKVHAQ